MPIQPKNIAAQLAFRARGNPPSTHPMSAISNCFPGLEFDFRNVWKNLFEGLEMHEAGLVNDGHLVVDVIPGLTAAQAGVEVFDRLVEVDGREVEIPRITPDGPTQQRIALELSNGLSHIGGKAGQQVTCVFVKQNGARVAVEVRTRPLFEGIALAEPIAEPGALTQSLCSPWQADYRECGCYYWAASRPDFVNAEKDASGNAQGHDWMQRDRTPGAPYQPDAGGRSGPAHVSYDDLYTQWETHLRFIVAGKDRE